ncbi:MAG: response regulator, partial [Pseudomonadales bacterium]
IIGFSDMLLEDVTEPGDEQLEKDLGKIRSAGLHLMDLINDVLDISSIEAGRTKLYLEFFELQAVLESVIDAVTITIEEKKLAFAQQIDKEISTMYGDQRKLKQVLLNVLSNAAKFTAEGEIKLHATTEQKDGERWIVIVVSDTGIGMSQEQQARVFEAFEQADASTTRKYGGTGLGLAISRRFCEMMGGQITLRSELGKGSTFTILMPERLQQREHSVRPGNATHTVLAIDDDPQQLELLSRSLGKRNIQVECAISGEEGLDLAQRLQPDLIVLDVILPGMDGWSVLTALKVSKSTAHIPVVMLTMLDQTDLGLALGATDYMVKPVEPARLLRTLRMHTGENGADILVVEDERDTREFFRRVLEGAGHRVREASNGLEGLNVLSMWQPQLIVLDLMMPEMDGFEFLDKVRSRQKFRNTPVLIATAKTLIASERSALEKTAQKIIEKNALSRIELIQEINVQVARALGIE